MKGEREFFKGMIGRGIVRNGDQECIQGDDERRNVILATFLLTLTGGREQIHSNNTSFVGIGGNTGTGATLGLTCAAVRGNLSSN